MADFGVPHNPVGEIIAGTFNGIVVYPVVSELHDTA
jgi:hypothetical protein